MSVTLYPEYSGLPPELDAFDETTCQIRIVCDGMPIGGYLHADENGVDKPTYRAVVALRAPDDDETPVLCCEECASWLVAAIK